jgi:hypothetical protein
MLGAFTRLRTNLRRLCTLVAAGALVPLLLLVEDAPAFAAACQASYQNFGNSGYYYAGEWQNTSASHGGVLGWITPGSQPVGTGSTSHIINYLALYNNNFSGCGLGVGCWVQGGYGEGNVGGYVDPYGSGNAGYIEMNGLNGDYYVDWLSPGYVTYYFFEEADCGSQPYIDNNGTSYSCSDCIISGYLGETCDSTYLPSYNGYYAAAEMENYQGADGYCSINDGEEFGAVDGSYNANTIIQASQDGTNFHPIFDWSSTVDLPYQTGPIDPQNVEDAFWAQGAS